MDSETVWPPTKWEVLMGLIAAAAVLTFFSTVLVVPQQDTLPGFTVRVFEFSAIKWTTGAVTIVLWAAMLVLNLIKRRSEVRFTAIDLAMILLVSYFVISSAWAPDSMTAWVAITHALGALAIYSLARIGTLASTGNVIFVFAVGAQLVTLAISVLTDDHLIGGGFGNENFGAEFMVLNLGVLIAFRGLRSMQMAWVQWFVIAASALYLLFFARPNLQYLGFIFGAIHFFVLWRPKITLPATFVAGLCVLVSVGWLVATQTVSVSSGVHERLQIWGNTFGMVGERPLLGTGAGGYFYHYANHIGSYVSFFPFLGPSQVSNLTSQTNTAENDLLHLVAEAGALGAVLAFVLLVVTYWTAFRSPRSVSARYALPLSIIIGVSLVSFPFQNAATLLVAAMMLGAMGGAIQGGASKRYISVIVAGVAGCLGALMLWASVPELRAAIGFSKAVALTSRPEEALVKLEGSLRHSSVSPLLRIRAYTQVMVAGPQYWQDHGITSENLDQLYALAVTASPKNPLLLDLRIKQMLSSTGRQVGRDDVEALIDSLKRATGREMANAHLLEAALAIQVRELDRAAEALDRARALIRYPLNRNDLTNAENLMALEAALAATPRN